MKTLYLIRHAKANWKKPKETDFERDLSKEGVQEISSIANKLTALSFKPEQIVCSSAKRTRETAELICSKIKHPIQDVKFDSSIYESSLSNLISLINSLPNSHNEIAIIGHNPSITHLSNYLTANLLGNIPTCSVIKIELEINAWNEIIEGIGIQKYFIYPQTFI